MALKLVYRIDLPPSDVVSILTEKLGEENVVKLENDGMLVFADGALQAAIYCNKIEDNLTEIFLVVWQGSKKEVLEKIIKVFEEHYAMLDRVE